MYSELTRSRFYGPGDAVGVGDEDGDGREPRAGSAGRVGPADVTSSESRVWSASKAAAIGVWHCGQRSAAAGRSASQRGQEVAFGTRVGGNYMTSCLLY